MYKLISIVDKANSYTKFLKIIVTNGLNSMLFKTQESYDNQIWNNSCIYIYIDSHVIVYDNCCLILSNHNKTIIILKSISQYE